MHHSPGGTLMFWCHTYYFLCVCVCCFFSWILRLIRPLPPGSYRLPAVELHALRQARLRLGPPLHLLHDSLDVIPGDPVEKHGSRWSWTQRATACLCLAAHNFHIPTLRLSAHRSGALATRRTQNKEEQKIYIDIYIKKSLLRVRPPPPL